jgi:hypothetical protein
MERILKQVDEYSSNALKCVGKKPTNNYYLKETKK